MMNTSKSPMNLKKNVFKFLTMIPSSKVVTYGQIAEYLGNKKLAIAIGNILHSNEDPDLYPCYKVVDRHGRLSKNYVFGGIDRQKERLEKDGIETADYKVNLDKYQFKI